MLRLHEIRSKSKRGRFLKLQVLDMATLQYNVGLPIWDIRIGSWYFSIIPQGEKYLQNNIKCMFVIAYKIQSRLSDTSPKLSSISRQWLSFKSLWSVETKGAL